MSIPSHSKQRPLLVISDAHVSEHHSNVQHFFDDLGQIEKTSWDVMFLGDIFELWVGHKRYESQNHHRFLEWCKTQKENRWIGFIEGNHEFFVTDKYAESFSKSSKNKIVDPERGLRFIHGDLVNRKDKAYLRFRRLTKNWFSKCFFRLLPFGPTLVDRLRISLKSTNKAYKIFFPKDEILSAWRQSDLSLVMGHFHQPFVQQEENTFVMVCPDYLSTNHGVLFSEQGLTWRIDTIRHLITQASR